MLTYNRNNLNTQQPILSNHSEALQRAEALLEKLEKRLEERKGTGRRQTQDSNKPEENRRLDKDRRLEN